MEQFPVNESQLNTNLERNNGKAIASLVLGLCSIITWLIPLFGLPTTIVGLIMGGIGVKSQKRGFAITGIVLSAIFLILTIINMVLGVLIFTNKL